VLRFVRKGYSSTKGGRGKTGEVVGWKVKAISGGEKRGKLKLRENKGEIEGGGGGGFIWRGRTTSPVNMKVGLRQTTQLEEREKRTHLSGGVGWTEEKWEGKSP